MVDMLDVEHPDKLAGKCGKQEEHFGSPDGVLRAALRSSRDEVASTVLKPPTKVRRWGSQKGSGKGSEDSGSSNT
eukprot:10105209-Heterocapsa_arctica.AAC.1